MLIQREIKNYIIENKKSRNKKKKSGKRTDQGLKKKRKNKKGNK